jgi:hypothetical protein
VGYVDLQRRRRGQGRGNGAGRDPYFFSTLGFGLATPASWLSYFMFWSGSPLPVGAIPLIPSTLLALLGAYELLRGGTSTAEPGPGAKKQSLMVMRESEGSITPVEAAVETSPTVDEAEEILSRLADRGHLTIGSREVALSYALRGRRSS